MKSLDYVMGKVSTVEVKTIASGTFTNAADLQLAIGCPSSANSAVPIRGKLRIQSAGRLGQSCSAAGKYTAWPPPYTDRYTREVPPN